MITNGTFYEYKKAQGYNEELKNCIETACQYCIESMNASSDEKIDKYHQELMDNNIFTVKVDHGIRLAICSLPIEKCYGLAKKLKNILDKM